MILAKKQTLKVSFCSFYLFKLYFFAIYKKAFKWNVTIHQKFSARIPPKLNVREKNVGKFYCTTVATLWFFKFWKLSNFFAKLQLSVFVSFYYDIASRDCFSGKDKRMLTDSKLKIGDCFKLCFFYISAIIGLWKAWDMFRKSYNPRMKAMSFCW